jgi:hypothetical protein
VENKAAGTALREIAHARIRDAIQTIAREIGIPTNDVRLPRTLSDAIIGSYTELASRRNVDFAEAIAGWLSHK